MPIFISRKLKAKPGTTLPSGPLDPAESLLIPKQSRLIDVRTPEAFRRGFLPGSYNVPDLACAAAARRNGLFTGRPLYLLADHIGQVEIYARCAGLSPAGQSITGWFRSIAIEERQRSKSLMGSFEAVNSEALLLRMAAWDTLVLDIADHAETRRPSHAKALRFGIDDLPSALDGLPVETSLCVTASTVALASFAASLLWNFGFHRISYLIGNQTPFAPAASARR